MADKPDLFMAKMPPMRFISLEMVTKQEIFVLNLLTASKAVGLMLTGIIITSFTPRPSLMAIRWISYMRNSILTIQRISQATVYP